MATPQEPKNRRWSAVGWWSLWIVVFVVSLLPPLVHRWRGIADIIEPLRYSLTRFLPAELLFLRHLGEWSHWIPVALVALLILGIRKPSARNSSIAFGALLTAVFSSIFCAYTLIVVSMYLVGYTQVLQKKQEAEQAGTGQPANRPVLESEGGYKPQPDAEGRSR
jgi:hypothetical protein